mmetsp:Transcript_17780/g.47832  ORF Transcript_17780/g.47832 Transcript_17780/m.47832 type:complete len:228 (+) Transcript_17780:84-767(+)
MPADYESRILYACITRDKVLLCEAWAHSEANQIEVQRVTNKLQARKVTPGWDSVSIGPLKAHTLPMLLDSGSVVSVLTVHNASFPTRLVKGFLEKAAMMFREVMDDPTLDLTTHLSAQALFAPTLEQRMEQASSQGKLALVTDKVEEVKDIMSDNIELMLAQHERVDTLRDKTEDLNFAARQFKKQTTRAKRFHLWNQAKMGVVIGTVATAATAAVVTPIVLTAMAV